jgi:hypothetical protein
MWSASSKQSLRWLFLIGFGIPMLLNAQNFKIQPRTNSPFSRFGLGDPNPTYFVAQDGMGGIGIAHRDDASANWVNPASFTSLDAASLELGIRIRNTSLNDGQKTTNVISGNLGYFSLAFPMNNRINQALERKRSKIDWGMGIGLVPLNSIGYNIQASQDLGEVGIAKNTFKGAGGVYNIKWANSVRFKNLSVGLEIASLFGKNITNTLVNLDSLRQAYAVELQRDLVYSGINFRLGAQYILDIDKKNKQGEQELGGRSIIFGAYFAPQSNFRTTGSSLDVRVNSATSTSSFVDTVAYTTGIRNSGVLPSQFGFGVSYQRLAKFKVSAEYSMGRWGAYRNDAKPQTLLNNWRAAMGVEYIPDVLSYNRYLRKARYRGGLFYGTDPRAINGVQIQNYGVTVGIGLPIIRPRQTTSYVNMALELGRFGAQGGIQSTYAQFSFGISLNDNTWFFKRKFN